MPERLWIARSEGGYYFAPHDDYCEKTEYVRADTVRVYEDIQ